MVSWPKTKLAQVEPKCLAQIEPKYPNIKVDLLIKLLDQNNGNLSKNKRQTEFEDFTDEEISSIEKKFQFIFGS